jgi:hypothetical protein
MRNGTQIRTFSAWTGDVAMLYITAVPQDITRLRPLQVNRTFGGIFRFHAQGKTKTLLMETMLLLATR